MVTHLQTSDKVPVGTRLLRQSFLEGEHKLSLTMGNLSLFFFRLRWNIIFSF